MNNIAINNSRFNWGSRTYIMGILNVTPDSFSNDGVMSSGQLSDDDIERAVKRALQMESEGADLIDIGGESTRPRAIYKDAEPIGAEEELARVVPVLRALRGVVSTPLSIDTYKAEVAEAALKEGATLINDISFLADPEMLKVANENGAPLVITHNGRAGQRYDDGDVVRIIDELEEAVKGAKQAGIKDDQIIVDPGIGFAKGMATNLAIIGQLRKFKSRLDYPLLAGISNKGFIGRLTDSDPDDRLEGNIAANILAVANGADIVRVHNVRAFKRALAVADAIVRQEGVPL